MKKMSNLQKKRRNILSKKRFLHNLKRKYKQKYLFKKSLQQRIINGRAKKFRSIEPPTHFSLLENYEEVLAYFIENYKLIQSGYSINLDLGNIDSLSIDAVAFLLSKVKDKKFTGDRMIWGKIPNNEDAKKMFKKSGFLEHVTSDIPKDEVLGGEMFLKATSKIVVPEIAKKIFYQTVNHTFGGDHTLCRELYPLLIELMTNTNNHAGEDFDWWVFYYKDESSVTKIIFLDLGKGIFKTLNKKWGRLNIVAKTLGFDSPNQEKLEALLKGEITDPTEKTSTGKNHRGEGLPFVYEFSCLHNVKNFNIISNDVRGNLTDGVFYKLFKDFNGTFYYWEMHPLT